MATNRSFAEVWSTLQRLRPIGQTDAWSRDGRTTSRFDISEIDDHSVTVRLESGKSRRISESEFGKLFERWDDYNSERLSRHELRNISQNSTYIITILHLIESQY